MSRLLSKVITSVGYAYVAGARVDFTSARKAAWEADVSWISTLPPRRTRPARPYKHIVMLIHSGHCGT